VLLKNLGMIDTQKRAFITLMKVCLSPIIMRAVIRRAHPTPAAAAHGCCSSTH